MYDIMKERNNNLNILIEISKFKENEFIKYQKHKFYIIGKLI